METPVIFLLFPRAWDLGFWVFFSFFLPPPDPFSYAWGWETSPSETLVSEAKISLQLEPFLICCSVAMIYQPHDSRFVLRSLPEVE